MNLKICDDREQASNAAAEIISSAMGSALEKGAASLIVSGGSTPGRCLEVLSGMPLDWQRIAVTLSDERLVSVDHAASNERMVRQQFLVGAASAATFLTLCPANVSHIIRNLGCALVGMGEDGHFASIFPDLMSLGSLLDIDAAPGVHRVQTRANDLPRITTNLSLLLKSRTIVLLSFGEIKRNIIDAPDGFPVAALLQQNRVPVQVIWAPEE